MNNFTEEKIRKLADLLMIGLTDEEAKMVLAEFNTIDKNINLINEIDGIKNVEPMTHALDNFYCTLREDTVEESININDLLSNCGDHNSREVIVPKVVGNNE